MSEGPVDRELADLAVVRVDVGAAAVLEVATDRVVVVAVDGWDRALLDCGADLVWMRAVADQVAAAERRIDFEPLDLSECRLERGKVRVDVADNGDAVQTSSSSRASSRLGSEIAFISIGLGGAPRMSS